MTDRAITIPNKEKDIVKILNIRDLNQSQFQGRMMVAEPSDLKSKDAIALQELATSIEESGMMQPIIVRPEPEGKKYEIIDGHRRVLATRKLGRGQIKAIIKNCTEREAQIMAVVANLQRKDLNAIEQAITYQKLLDTKVFRDKRELSFAIGKDETHVGDLLNALNMDPRIIAEQASKNLIKDIRVLRMIRMATRVDQEGKSEEQWALYRKVVWQKLSRADLKNLIREKKKTDKPKQWKFRESPRKTVFSIQTHKLKPEEKAQLIRMVEEKLEEVFNK